MNEISIRTLDQLAEHGFVMLRGAFLASEIDTIAERLSQALQSSNDPSVLKSRGRIYGSRNLLETWPEVRSLVSRPTISGFITEVLGQDAGIVRVLYFDKPPDRTWSLPWHRDKTIAVRTNERPSMLFLHPTFKAGVPHVEAPRSVLEAMLTIRIHLDAMTQGNGPLSVIPGSHCEDADDSQSPVELYANPGDVLAMRPLLSHSSSMSRPGTTSHRRVVHIEIAGNRELPDGYEWYSFVPHLNQFAGPSA